MDIDLDEIVVYMFGVWEKVHEDAKEEEWGHIIPIAHDEIGP